MALVWDCFSILLISLVLIGAVSGFGDFVEDVSCRADGILVTLKEELPDPRWGMWDLEVDGFPQCPGVTKTDVGGGHSFSILFADKQWCGVQAISMLTPAWVTVARTVLLLTDDNGTTIADSISCIYDTRFETSLLTFQGQITHQNLLYGGSLQEDIADVETTVYSSEAVSMDFFDQVGRALQHRRVKLGDPIMFKIAVSERKQVSKLLPENCYFSSSSIAEENVLGGQTLPFIKQSCFNNKNGIVRTFLPKMERSQNGSSYEMRFPAFHFTGYGENLFVHCTIMTCVGDQSLCEPRDECFGINRRQKRSVINDHDSNIEEKSAAEKAGQVVISKYIAVRDWQQSLNIPSRNRLVQVGEPGRVCMPSLHFLTMIGSVSACLLLLLIITASLMVKMLIGRNNRKNWKRRPESVTRNEPIFAYYDPSVYSQPNTLSFASAASTRTLPATIF